jgi:Penicillin amidase
MKKCETLLVCSKSAIIFTLAAICVWALPTPNQCKDGAKVDHAPRYRIANKYRTVEDQPKLVIQISVNPRRFNRADLTLLAQQLNNDFCRENLLYAIILANDPHRTIALPSLRYLVHLVGPGWNVIGAGEPALPGVAAGHNERAGFGFIIVGIDQQDLYVEEINPANTHALSTDAERRALFNLPSVERSGDGNTVNSTGGPNFRQSHGASFREILDVSDWDRSVATNVPGQSGQPGSKHYGDLLPLWAEGKYFPLLYSEKKVEAMAKQRLTLEPAR